jgi:hypothetical protein
MDWNDLFLNPLREFFTSILTYLPKIVAALVLLLLAWILAKVFRNLTRRLVKATGVDRRMGKADQYPIANGTGTAVFWIIWILFILAILQVLGVEGVLSSIQLLFVKIFDAIPNILAAAIVLVVFYFVSRLIARWVTKFLTRVRFNEVPVKLGLTTTVTEGAGSPASIVGYIIIVVIMLLAIIIAADLLNFTVLNELIAGLTTFLAQVILGVIIIAVGIFIANFIARILQSGGRSSTTATMVRIFIIILAVAIGLRAMGFANDIILLAFGLMLGALAVAAAIAFGLGGRKTAGQLVERWTKTGGPENNQTQTGGTENNQTQTSEQNNP